jgi:hypothetical protein
MPPKEVIVFLWRLLYLVADRGKPLDRLKLKALGLKDFFYFTGGGLRES